jgi:hypothetical protein
VRDVNERRVKITLVALFDEHLTLTSPKQLAKFGKALAKKLWWL